MHAMATAQRNRLKPSRRSFSLTELLVVIAIIILLIGLLLTALSTVKKKADRTKTTARMQQFLNACSSFQAQHGRYPGVVPDDVLAADGVASGINTPELSSTENALLELWGGFRARSPQDTDPDNPIVREYNEFRAQASAAGTLIELTIGSADPSKQWRVAIDTRKFGEGPVIGGKPYAPYFTPGPGDTVVAKYPHADGDPSNQIPDLVDDWGQPIIYLRQSRSRGPLCRDQTMSAPPQFECSGVQAYLNSNALGEMSSNQLMGGDPRGSILTIDAGGGFTGSVTKQNMVMATILSNQAFYNSIKPFQSQPRAAVVLISAGPDGIYFSAADGPGSPGAPIDSGNLHSQVTSIGPKVIEEFDDIRVFGGG